MNNDNITGYVAWRMWHLYALLQSTSGNAFHPSTTWTYPMRSKGLPTASNNKGLYAFSFGGEVNLTPELLDDYLDEIDDINTIDERSVGVVELRGRILIHSNGVCRAQWARPILIWVDISLEEYHMNKLAQAYQCPIIATDDFIKSLNIWETSEGKEIIDGNIYKSACYGESAESVYGIPKISKEIHNEPQATSQAEQVSEQSELLDNNTLVDIDNKVADNRTTIQKLKDAIGL